MADGAAEGVALGEAVGPAVGVAVGPRVGPALGVAVGSADGARVGPADGASVGPAEGTVVGPAVGLVVGDAVGASEASRALELVGLVVGRAVGHLVGTNVGAAVVGVPVGASVVGAALHAAASIVLTASCSELKLLTLNTRVDEPAMSTSSDWLIPRPTPTARMVIWGIRRASCAAVRVAARLFERPSVRTTIIRGTVVSFRMPLWVLKMSLRAVVSPAPVLVPPRGCRIPRSSVCRDEMVALVAELNRELTRT